MVKPHRIAINPACPLRSALTQILGDGRRSFTTIPDVAFAAGVEPSRVKSFVTILAANSIVLLGEFDLKIRRGPAWLDYEEALSHKRWRTHRAVSPEQRERLRDLRDTAAKTLAERLKFELNKRGWDQPRFANEAGLSGTTVKKLLRGAQMAPAIDILQACATVEVSLDGLFADLRISICEVLQDRVESEAHTPRHQATAEEK